jgi:hypothetical protein
MEIERKPYVKEVHKFSPTKGPILKVNTSKLLKNSKLNLFIDNIEYVDRIKHLPIRKDLYLNEFVRRYKEKNNTEPSRTASRMSRLEVPQLAPYKGSVNFYMIRNDPTRNYRDIKKQFSLSPRVKTGRSKKPPTLVPISPTLTSYSLVQAMFGRDRCNFSELRYGSSSLNNTLPRLVSSPIRYSKTQDAANKAEFDVDEFKEIRQKVFKASPLKVLKEESKDGETFWDSDSDYERCSIKPWENV